MSLEAKMYLDIFMSSIYLCLLFASIIEDKRKSFSSPLTGVLVALMLHMIFAFFTNYIDLHRLSYISQYIFCSLYPLTGFLSLYFYGIYFKTTCGASPIACRHIKIFNMAILILNIATTFPFIPSGLFFSVSQDGVYTRGSLFFFSYVFGFAEMLALTVFAVVKIKNKRKALGYVAFSTFPIIASICIALFSIPAIIEDMSTALSCLLLHSFVYIEGKRDKYETEAKLTKYKADIMLSQIGPHFIYNTLSTISALCSIDPERAQKLTNDFADYLRTNLSLAKADRLSAFEHELRHTKKYLEIEQVRFGSRVNVEYDIRESDFMMPSLSLQPIVENAVKHGITAKEEGGTVKISTKKQGKYIYITIADDGVGFNPALVMSKEGHYGLFTTKDRIRIMLGGEVDIQSTVGVGTVVTMKFRQIKEI